ncbi:hypothetical protein ACFFX0_33245 [Citricoccus parietis]|uniref:Uncharacterized protein n=1 Tax=Citricoccus parietis TaxID=592307 RepID=A0ABV5GA28_9MICC
MPRWRSSGRLRNGSPRQSGCRRVMEDYRRLFPQVDEAWPGKGVGLAASVDTVRKVTVAVIFGTCSVSIHNGLGLEAHEEWIRWCRGDAAIAACSASRLLTSTI